MEQHISPESLQLIANLINDKNKDLKDYFQTKHDDLMQHMSDQIRMVKLTVQENHEVAVEGRDYGKLTNGRVTKLEDTVYGEFDKNCNKIKGREGLRDDLDKIKKWQWLYSDWKVLAAIWIGTTALYVEQSRNFMIKIIDKIF